MKNAKELFLVLFIGVVAVIGGAYGINFSASGGDSSGSGSVSMNTKAADSAAMNGIISINGATVIPQTSISGPVSNFEETHGVSDSTGKSAQVYVKVVNAPNGLTYASYVQPGEGKVKAQKFVSAEQWLTVPQADSITCTSSASYGTATKMSASLDKATSVTGYYGRAYVDAATVSAMETGHVKGPFIGTAKVGTNTKTRTPNYGSEYDLTMTAIKGTSSSAVTGNLGYYVDPSTIANKIQGAVDAAQSGDTINLAAGTYNENVNINKGLTLKGSGNPTANSFSLNAILGTGSGGITAPIVNVNPVAKIQDGITLASSGGTVNVAAGTYNENVNINKGLTLKGSGNPTANSFSLNAILGTGSGGITAPIVNVNPVAKIQDGITLASSGGTVNVAAGTYNENVQIDKSLTVQGAGADKTTVNGLGGSVFAIGETNPKTAATLSGMTIKGGSADYGGGIYNEGTATLSGLVVSGNTAHNDGGGIFNRYGSTLTVTGSTLSKNTAGGFGGGVYNYGTTTVTGSTISGNTAKLGGGVYNIGTGTVTGSTISGNTANNNGGGIANYGYFVGSTYQLATLDVADSTIISGNSATGYGGGITNDGTVNVIDSTLSGNTGLYGGGIYNDGNMKATTSTLSGNNADFGGGVLNDAMATIIGSIISGNTAKNTDGGGIANYGDWVNGVYKQANLDVSGTTISGNSATGYGGGITNDGIATITDSDITRNNAIVGAGVYNDGSVKIIGARISENTASRGGGFYNDGTATIKDGEISGNTANNNGGGIYNGNTLFVGGTSQIMNNKAITGYGGGVYSYSGPVTFDGTGVNVISNSAHLPSSESSWYWGRGVYSYIGLPTITGGFDPAKQVTGNVQA